MCATFEYILGAMGNDNSKLPKDFQEKEYVFAYFTVL